MTGVHHSLNGTQSKVGLSLETSVGQGRQDKVANGPAEAEGDSGDSLFITQKTLTLPEAGRSGRRPHYSRRSKPVSPRDLEGSEDSSSSASCDEELKTQEWRRRKKCSLPQYSFPFLQEGKRQSGLLPDQNKSLHNYTIGGFFKCLGELRQNYRRGQDLEPSLPTVDVDGENISPLSEEDGERSEEEDIKVVERKHFVASSRTKSQQTWCNQLKEQRRRKNGTQKGREASEPVTEQAGPRTRSQRLLHRPPERTAVTKVEKKRRKEESEGLLAAASVNMQAKETPSLSEGCRAAKTSNVLDLSGNDNTLRQEEGDIPDSTQKRKKNKSRAESVGQEVDVGVEDCVVSVSCDVEDGGKKKRKISGEDVEQLKSGAVAEPLNDDADIQKKKERGKELGIVIPVEHEEEEASNKTLDLPPVSTEQLEASGNTPEEEGKFENVYHQKTNEVLEEQNAEPVKKKKSGIFSWGVSEDKVGQSEDSASAREKGNKRKSSFLVADAEENDVEELNDGVTKWKRKRKTSAEQESVEEGHEWDCEEPDKTRRGALPQSADTGRKRKNKRTGSESEGLVGAADAAFSPHGEAAVLKKCNDVMKEGPPTATTCRSVSRKEKGKHCDSAKVSHDGSTHDQASTGTLTSVECDLASSNDARDKKKKKLKNEGKSSTESAELEPIENIKKQKERKMCGKDVKQLKSGAVAEPLNDDADIQKKKKKKKKLGIVIPEEHGEEEASNRTLDFPPVSTEQLEASGNCSENAAAAQETLGSSFVKRKKHKKKQQSLNNEAPQDGVEGADVSFGLDDSVILAKGSGTSLKKKRKSLFVGMNFSSYTPEEEGKFENVYHQKTNEGLEEQNAEPVKKKKKKKKSGIFSRGVSEDKVRQSGDSASAREKEKKRNSSFLVADAEENDVEELNDGVSKRKRKRKRKRKTSAEQESVEEGHEWDCEEPDKTRRGALPQSADTGRKRKNKRTGSESEGLDGAADAAFSPHDEAAVLKKKKKKCNDVMKEDPPTATTCRSVSRKERGKRCDSAKVSHDGSTHDQASTGTLTSVECDLASSNDSRDKKKKKLKNEGKSSTKSAELEPIENIKKQKERNEQSTIPETSDIVKNKQRMLKRKLHNPNGDFFTDSPIG